MNRLCGILALVVLGGGWTDAPAGDKSSAKTGKIHVAVFDFASRPAALGQQLADSLRLKLRRHEEYDVIDVLTTREASGALPADADGKKVIALMAERLAADLALYGTVSQSGPTVRAEVCYIDLTGGRPRTWWRKVFADQTERARGVISTAIVEQVRARPQWRPPEYGDEAEPKDFGRALNVNGDFETGRAGWDAPDNASTFLEPRPAGRGRVLRIRTDLERDRWLEYQRQLRFGLADPNHPPKLERDTSYGSVAGLEGVHYRSAWIRAGPGRRYWLVAEMKGKTAGIFFPKIFIKGYGDFTAGADGLPEQSLVEMKMTPGAFAGLPRDKQRQLIAQDAKAHPERYRREVYRWYLSCRNEEGVWKHYAAPFPPRGGLPANVRWLRINVYAYWPPGEYYFDDVHLYADPRQEGPLPEEKARTPGFEQLREEMERARTQPTQRVSRGEH